MKELNRFTYLHFRASEDESEALRLMAELESRNLSDMTRQLIREGAQRRGLEALGLVSLVGKELIGGKNESNI